MKRILKSLLVLSITLGTVASSTVAYFTSSVSAADNVISTGTLRLGIGASPTGAGNNGYWVSYDDGANGYVGTKFPAITNVQPGEAKSQFVAVANIGSLPFYYRASVIGDWATDSLLASMMSVSSVRRYPTNNCLAEPECLDLYTWLTGAGYTHTGISNTWGAVSGDFGNGVAGIDDGGFMLNPNSFSIYKIGLTLSTEAKNEYQDETFTYTLNAQARQLNSPSF